VSTPPPKEQQGHDQWSEMNQIIKSKSPRTSLPATGSPVHAIRRCSRPLCSSQSTVGTPPGHQHSWHQTEPRGPATTFPRCPIPQDPTACTPPSPRPDPFHTPREGSRTTDPAGSPAAHHQRSTHELHPRTLVSMADVWHRRTGADAP
jgi:hypothetical protein